MSDQATATATISAPARVELAGRLLACTGHAGVDATIVVQLVGPSQYDAQLRLTDLVRRQGRVRIVVEEIEEGDPESKEVSMVKWR